MDKDGYHGYDAPVIDESAAKRIATALGWEPKRTWVGLTDDEIQVVWNDVMDGAVFTRRNVYNAIEAKLKEKNNG